MTWTPGALVALQTERFNLRSIEREDVTEEFAGWLADPAVMVGMNLPRKRLTRVQAVRWALAFDNRRGLMILVTDRSDDRQVGMFTISLDTVHNTAETAVVIGNHDYWGKNVVVECRTALMDFLFDEIGVHKVIGRPHGRNFSSIFNYKAMGFTCEAVLREHMRPIDGDGRLDQLIFGMLRTEWQARREAQSS